MSKTLTGDVDFEDKTIKEGNHFRSDPFLRKNASALYDISPAEPCWSSIFLSKARSFSDREMNSVNIMVRNQITDIFLFYKNGGNNYILDVCTAVSCAR